MTVRSVVVIGGLAGCNFALGLDDTVLVTENPRALVFDNRASATDLVDFPVLVTLDATRIEYAEVGDPKTDLRFHDPDTDQDLAFEIEHWEPGGASAIWVRVPQIDARSDSDRILMYYGAAAAGMERPAETWSQYAFVFHAEPNRYDSPVGGARGMAVGVMPADGPVASALRFTGPNEAGIAFSNTGSLFDGWDRFTLEFWLYADYASSGAVIGEPRLIENSEAVRLGRLLKTNADILLRPQIDMVFEVETTTQQVEVPLRTWIHLVYTFDGRNLWAYRNGEPAELWPLPTTTRLVQGAGTLVLGGQNPLQGLLDEVRISRSGHAADWVKAQFLAMTGRFVTYALGNAR